MIVNDREARSVGMNFAEWEVELAVSGPGESKLSAHGEDGEGNVESTRTLSPFDRQVNCPAAIPPHGSHCVEKPLCLDLTAQWPRQIGNFHCRVRLTVTEADAGYN